MPQVIIYLTDHIGLNIIPINLVLQVIVSYLVGLNEEIEVNEYTIYKKGRGASRIGAIAGLFIACQNGAGSFLSVFIGTQSGSALSIALNQMQTFLIVV